MYLSSLNAERCGRLGTPSAGRYCTQCRGRSVPSTFWSCSNDDFEFPLLTSPTHFFSAFTAPALQRKPNHQRQISTRVASENTSCKRKESDQHPAFPRVHPELSQTYFSPMLLLYSVPHCISTLRSIRKLSDMQSRLECPRSLPVHCPTTHRFGLNLPLSMSRKPASGPFRDSCNVG